MDIKLIRVPKSKKHIIFHLLQFYFYDFNDIFPNNKKIKLNKDALFDYPYFEDYWKEKTRVAYLVKVNDEIAGFVLIHQYSMLHISQRTNVMGEFFILKNFRNQGVGTEVAKMIFQQHPGEWEVPVVKENSPAFAFWENLFKQISLQKLKLHEINSPDWTGTVFLIKV